MNCKTRSDSSRTRQRPFIALSFIAALATSFPNLAYAITFPVFAGSTEIGEVSVDPEDSGVHGGFFSQYGTPPSLHAAAQLGNDHHFNWFQVIIADNDPLNGANGQPLTPPYLDPPPGGYGSPDTHWADGLPWLWDEGADPPPGTPGFDDGYNVNENVFDFIPLDGVKDFLFFEDFPEGPRGSSVTFRTWLVSVSANGALNDFHYGFQWSWSNPTDNAGASVISSTLLTPLQGLALYDQVFPTGDYNHDGVVDAADYVAWRKGPIPSTVANYNVWKNRFGQSSFGSGGGADAPIPEPSTCYLLAAMGVMWNGFRRVAVRSR